MSKRIEIELPFMGFYESLHDELLDEHIRDAVAYAVHGEGFDEISLVDGQQIDNVMWEADIDWTAIREAYCKVYVEQLSSELGLDLEFADLVSPKYYNFSTDRLFVTIPEEEAKRVRKVAEQSDGWMQRIKDMFSDRDGFHSFFSPDTGDDVWTREQLDAVQYIPIMQTYVEEEERKEWNDIETDLIMDTIGNLSSEVIDNTIEQLIKAVEEKRA